MRHALLVAASVAAVLASASPSRAQQTATAPDSIAGLYGAEVTLGPQVRGIVTLMRAGTEWTAQLGGFEVRASGTASSVRLVLSGDQGELRGALADDGHTIRGFWIQPPGIAGAFATPIRLDAVRPGVWRGRLAPLDESFSLYLQIQPRPDGSLRGVFRNPEMNWPGRVPWFTVAKDTGTLVFTDPSTGKVRFTQPFDNGTRGITFDFGTPVVLTPRSREQVVGFLPRSPSAQPYTYRRPLPELDGWATADASSVGMDADRLRALVERLLGADPADDRAPRIHALLVARHGKLVLDEYFYGFTPDRLHDLRSASKTLTSVMAGAAMIEHPGFGPDTPVAALFAGADALVPADPRVGRITVGHLLSHSAGLACDDNDSASPGQEDTMQRQRAQRDWYRFTLSLPVVHEPGTTYSYCSGGINLVGGAIARLTGSWLPDFFDRRVARPLQIERYAINLMPSGDAYAGGGIHMRPRDFLKFGQAYLDGGMWNGQRIVPLEWARQSTARHIDAPNGSTDGFGWHRYALTAGTRTYQEYEASGNGGQFLIVVPELDLVVVVVAGNYNEYAVWRTIRDELVPRELLPAVTGR